MFLCTGNILIERGWNFWSIAQKIKEERRKKMKKYTMLMTVIWAMGFVLLTTRLLRRVDGRPKRTRPYGRLV